jgi:hypothetical protein
VSDEKNDAKAVQRDLRNIVTEYFPRDALQIMEDLRVATNPAPILDERDATLILGTVRATFAEE